jgi:hypothetical protein
VLRNFVSKVKASKALTKTNQANTLQQLPIVLPGQVASKPHLPPIKHPWIHHHTYQLNNEDAGHCEPNKETGSNRAGAGRKRLKLNKQK